MKLVRDYELLRAICVENGIRVGTVFELYGSESKTLLCRSIRQFDFVIVGASAAAPAANAPTFDNELDALWTAVNDLLYPNSASV